MNSQLAVLLLDLTLLTRGILDNNVETADRQLAVIDQLVHIPADVLPAARSVELRKAVISAVPQRILTQMLELLAPPKAAVVETPVAEAVPVVETPVVETPVADTGIPTPLPAAETVAPTETVAP